MSDDKAPTSTVRKKHFFQPNQPEIETSGSALINLGFYSFLMFTVPLGIFFLAKDYLAENSWPEVYVTILPAIAAILSVNIIIVFYVISAFKADKKEKSTKID